MLCPGLSVGLIYTVIAILPYGDSRGIGMPHKNRTPFLAGVGVVRHQQDLRELCEGVYLNESEGKYRKMPHWIQHLNRVTLKLSNIIGKYNRKKEHLNELYRPVAYCGLGNCGKDPNVMPEKMNPDEFDCKKFRRLKDLEKWTSVILSMGYNRSKTYEDQFEELIRFERKRHLRKPGENNGSRTTILNELKNEIRVLRLEINECDKQCEEAKERLNASEIATNSLQIPKAQTDLMIREWKILQQSREYLRLFCKSLHFVYKCWKERKSGSKKFSKKEKTSKTKVVGLNKKPWKYQREGKTKNGNY